MCKAKAEDKLLPILKKACEKFPQHADFPAAIVKVSEQVIYLFADQKYIAAYPVSTSRYGIGQEEGSNKTPLGAHFIKEKIGAKAAPCEIISSRKPTNNIATIESRAIATEKDCITSRILWLTGLESGLNSGLNEEGVCVDSAQRFIYIHGTHEEGLIGQEASIGCVRMKNEDVIDVFDQLRVSSLVLIEN